MSEGYFVVHATAANAGIPIPDAIVAVTQNGKLIAVRMTDRSGRTAPITIATPDVDESLSPEGDTPYAQIDVVIDHPSYMRISARNVQVFPGQVTEQDFNLIPDSLLPDNWDATENFNTPPQNL